VQLAAQLASLIFAESGTAERSLVALGDVHGFCAEAELAADVGRIGNPLVRPYILASSRGNSVAINFRKLSVSRFRLFAQSALGQGPEQECSEAVPDSVTERRDPHRIVSARQRKALEWNALAAHSDEEFLG
jgi:hypothetical protein